MIDSPELAEIRARDAGCGTNDAWMRKELCPSYWDRRTLLRMLDETRQGIVLLQHALLTVRTSLGLHRDSTDHLGEVAERMRAENERLREAMERGSDA